MKRTALVAAALGLVTSLLASLLVWVYFETVLLFLFVPFVPFLFRRLEAGETTREQNECPQCGFRTTTQEYEYCPRDGRRLIKSGERRDDGRS